MSIQFRSATPEDIATCIVIRGKTRENAISATRLAELGITLQSWSDQVKSHELCGHIGESDGQIVGYCFGASESGEVVVLALLPEYENQGIGKQLLNLMMAELQFLGHQRLFLGCSSDPQVRSHGFYRRLGWRSAGVTDKYGDDMLEYFIYQTELATPNVATYCALRVGAGLSAKTEAAAALGLPGTLFAVQILHAGQAVGMGRVIGDGGCFYQVVDIAVLREHQGRGLGKRIMVEIMQFIHTNAPESAYISLIADGKAQDLYAQFGFKHTAPNSVGMAMLKRG